MDKKAWIIYISITIAIFAVGSLCMIVLVPQIDSNSEFKESYVGINKMEYQFDSSANDKTLSKEYNITTSDVNKALKQDKYEQGNINPFTPKKEVTIYNEPTLNNGTNSNKPLTPSDK